MQTTYTPPEAVKLIAERNALTDEKLRALYQEHMESPYVDTPLTEERFRQTYRRFLNVEIAAWKALGAQRWALHDRMDRESQRLCARLGY
jgi:hypothetical protein